MAKTPLLDTAAETQSIDQPNRRSIYDAGLQEIFVKSFVAGIGLGIGRMIATLIFFGIIAGIFVTYLEPLVMNLSTQLKNSLPSFLIPAPATTNTNRFQYTEDQFFNIFNSNRLAPQETIEGTETTTTQ